MEPYSSVPNSNPSNPGFLLPGGLVPDAGGTYNAVSPSNLLLAPWTWLGKAHGKIYAAKPTGINAELMLHKLPPPGKAYQ